jgi:hypothetical protein
VALGPAAYANLAYRDLYAYEDLLFLKILLLAKIPVLSRSVSLAGGS